MQRRNCLTLALAALCPIAVASGSTLNLNLQTVQRSVSTLIILDGDCGGVVEEESAHAEGDAGFDHTVDLNTACGGSGALTEAQQASFILDDEIFALGGASALVSVDEPLFVASVNSSHAEIVVTVNETVTYHAFGWVAAGLVVTPDVTESATASVAMLDTSTLTDVFRFQIALPGDGNGGLSFDQAGLLEPGEYRFAAFGVTFADDADAEPVDATAAYESVIRFGVPGDINGDHAVDSTDLNMLLADFGCAEACEGDADMDGDVDSADLNLLLAAFGR